MSWISNNLQTEKCTLLIWTFLNKLSNFFEHIFVWCAWISCHLKPRLQNSLFLRREIENPSAFIKWETGKRKWMRERKEWGEGLKKETVAFAYFKSVLEFSVPQETQNSYWSVFRQELLSITHHNPSKAVDLLRYEFGKLNMDLHEISCEKLSGIVLKANKRKPFMPC